MTMPNPDVAKVAEGLKLSFRPFKEQSASELRAEWVYWTKAATQYSVGSAAQLNCIYFAKRCRHFLHKKRDHLVRSGR